MLLSSCNNEDKGKKYKIGYSQFSTNENWSKAVTQSMKIEEKYHDNIELVILDSKSNVDTQISHIEKFIKQGVHAIIVSPIATKPLKAIVNKALKSKIPVILLDREIDNFTSFVGIDNYEVGINAAKYLQSLKRKVNVVEIKGWAGTSPTKHISYGFHTIIEKNDSLKVVAKIQDSYDDSDVKEKFKKLLESEIPIDYVFAHSDDLALKAYKVAEEMNVEKKIKFIGVGGLHFDKGGVSLVKEKILEATILRPTGGKEAFDVAVKTLQKEKVDKSYMLPSVIVDSTNVDLLERQLSLINSQELDINKQQLKLREQIKLYNSQKDFLIATLIFLAIIILLLIITFRSKQKLINQKRLLVKLIDQIDHQKKEIEQIAEDLKVANEATNNFFTGVSHDFKTPISLILSSTESLIGSKQEQKPTEFNLIYNNSKRLLRMINQLLDFRRVESRKFKLKASKTNIKEFVEAIYVDFKSEAEKKKINFLIKTEIKEPNVYIDRNLFDNLLFNLFSNAFKFTPKEGDICIKITEDKSQVFISIKDSGIGILENEKDKIFNQFFQGSNNNQSSSGIGLYLTKEYIKLHKGTIEVVSKKEKGAEFIISIPKGNMHLKSEEILINEEIKVSEFVEIASFEQEKPISENEEEKETLLIIEDNTDLREFLKEKLSSVYKVYDSDGLKVVEEILQIVPDIILSDVNLPDKNGFEICKFIKNDERISHIPVIILTALNTEESHLEGLRSGVDMFLTKPFNLSVLFQSIESLLYNRKKLQYYYKEKLEKNFSLNATNKKKNKNNESEFLEKINTYIRENIDDSTFTVEILADKLGISRVQLYRKIKAVLGITISDYIQNIRLEKGKKMLIDQKKLTIADIAYSVGFSSPNYFSTAFKNKFGITPKKFKNLH